MKFIGFWPFQFLNSFFFLASATFTGRRINQVSAWCGKQSSATQSTQIIRCHGCEELISVSKKTETVSSGINRQLSKEQCKTFFCTKCPLYRVRQKPVSTDQTTASPSTNGNYSICDSISTWGTTPGKRALLIGVTYEKQKFKLQGTIYDVQCMKELLIDHFHFPSSSIHILIEDEAHHHPTKRNIQAALKWLVKESKSGDSLVFYFSGHGLRQPDFDEDERDGFDETICPLDFRSVGMITDNEINATIVRPLDHGVKLHAIVDSCHSGTVLDLTHIYGIKEKKWVDNHPPSGVNKGTNGGLAICFSACQDNQLASDTSAMSGKEMAGAMTYNFKKVVERNPRITYVDLLTSIQKAIKDERKVEWFNLKGIFNPHKLQEPLLSSSEEFDLNMELKL